MGIKWTNLIGGLFSKMQVFQLWWTWTILNCCLWLNFGTWKRFQKFTSISVAWMEPRSISNNLMFHCPEQKRIEQICMPMSLFWLLEKYLQCQVPACFCQKTPSREHIKLSITGNQTPGPWWFWLLWVAMKTFSLTFPWIYRMWLNTNFIKCQDSISVEKHQRIFWWL